MTPSPEEAAYMAEHIYHYDMSSSDEERTVAGWKLIDVYDGGYVSSVKIGVYIPEGDDPENPSEYALVYRGSTMDFSKSETWSVWGNNFLSFISCYSIDMKAAILIGQYFDITHSQEITFVGHSKGGGEAIAAASATNNNAITFNAANFNFLLYGVLDINKSGIVNYYIKHEVLSTFIGQSSYGTNYTVDSQFNETVQKVFRKQGYSREFTIIEHDMFKNHGMEAFEKAWGLNFKKEEETS